MPERLLPRARGSFAQVRHTNRDRQPERQGGNCECAPRPRSRTIANQEPRQHAEERTQAVARNGKGHGEGDHTVDQRADAAVVPPAISPHRPATPDNTAPSAADPADFSPYPPYGLECMFCKPFTPGSPTTPCSPAPPLISLV